MKIGIIGASSQVGSSLAFYLRHFTGAEPVCFVRSSYSKVFFEIAGIRCDTVDLSDAAALKDSLAGLDGVVDCTYPSGQLYEIPAMIEKNLSTLIGAMAPNSFFIYMSTIMAFGMPTGYKHVRNFTVPQTTYAFIKRKAEKLTKELCTKHNIKGYNFRLGQVHGFLQSVNSSYREKLSSGEPLKVDGVPGSQVNVIFISTLAQAIIQVGKNEFAPGQYSLVNEPQWTLENLYRFYLEYYRYNTTIIYEPSPPPAFKTRAKAWLTRSIKQFRPVIESYVLVKREKLYRKVKGRYRVNEVANTGGAASRVFVTDFHLLGNNPGVKLKGLESSLNDVLKSERLMEELYNGLLGEYVKTAGEAV